MLVCCDSHIRHYHYMDVFRPTVIITWIKWKEWAPICLLAHHSRTTKPVTAWNAWKVGQNNDTPQQYTFPAQYSQTSD